MSKRLSIPFASGVALLAWGLLSPPAQLVQETVREAPAKAAPENYAINVSVSEFGVEGELLSVTRANALRRYPVDALVELDQPQREGHNGNFSWTAQASTGRLLERRDLLQLRGDVDLRYATEDVRFTSEAMNVNLAMERATSLAPVRSWQGEHLVRADSLIVELDKQVALLSGDVRSLYVPEPQH